MWLACYTQEEIAEAVGYSQQKIADFIKESSFTAPSDSAETGKTPETDDDTNSLGRITLSKTDLANADHATDFETPIYNIWKQQGALRRGALARYFGRPVHQDRRGKCPISRRASDP